MTARQEAIKAAAALVADRLPTQVIHDYDVVAAVRDASPAWLGAHRIIADTKRAAHSLRFERIQAAK